MQVDIDALANSIGKSDGIDFEMDGKVTGVFPQASESPDIRRSRC